MAGEKNLVHVEEEALSGYSKAAARLSEDLRAVGTRTLSGADALPDDVFGRLGSEVGLAAAFKHVAQSQLDGVASTANGIAALGKAVGEGLVGYQQHDADAGAHVRKADQS